MRSRAKTKRSPRKRRSPQQERLKWLRENTSHEAVFKRALERTAAETARLMGKGK
jgi:hypothetical protein